jgi:uncharacterized protein
MKIYYWILTSFFLFCFGCFSDTHVPDEVVAAVSEVARGNGFQPREPHFILEQYIPAVTDNKAQRAGIASILLEAVASGETTPAGRTVLAQHLAKVAGDAERNALEKMSGDPQREADIRIALGEATFSSIKKEDMDVYKAEIMSDDPAKQISGLSAISFYYPEVAPQYCLDMIKSWEHDVYATATGLLAKLDPQALNTAVAGIKKGNDFGKVIRVLEEHKLTDLIPVEEPVIKANKGGEKKILIVTGNEYPGHPWQETAPALVDFLARDTRLEVSYVEDPRIMAQPRLDAYDVIVLNYQNHEVPAPQGALENLKEVVEGGRGLVLVHFACGAFIDWETRTVSKEFAEIAGRVWNPGLRGHDPRGMFHVNIIDNDHPVTKGLSDFDTDDELYTCLDGTEPIDVLAKARSKVDGKDYPMAFVLTPGKGRTFHCVLGHDLKAMNDDAGELYRRGTLWASGLEIK